MRHHDESHRSRARCRGRVHAGWVAFAVGALVLVCGGASALVWMMRPVALPPPVPSDAEVRRMSAMQLLAADVEIAELTYGGIEASIEHGTSPKARALPQDALTLLSRASRIESRGAIRLTTEEGRRTARRVYEVIVNDGAPGGRVEITLDKPAGGAFEIAEIRVAE